MYFCVILRPFLQHAYLYPIKFMFNFAYNKMLNYEK